MDQLVREQVAACDPRWRSLYFEACAERRKTRLQALRERAAQFIYVKHGIFGCMQGLAGKYDVPDEQVRDYTFGFKPGGQLCLGTVLEDGTIQHEVLLEKPAGAICYPTLSWDARTLVFSMRDNFESDSYYLYTLDMATRRVRQRTFPLKKNGKPLPIADCEPAFLPDGRIVFTSTRDVHISDCWYRAGGNIYCCDADGGNLRRLTFDQLMSNNPQVLDDGRIVFTRWEYNDRNALFAHPLISMNPDGTAQTVYYGNYSMFPAAIIHAHGIPGSPKSLAIVAGHHSIYKGKLGLIDRAQGLWAGKGIEFVNTKLNGDRGRESADFIQPEPPDPSRPHLDFKIRAIEPAREEENGPRSLLVQHGHPRVPGSRTTADRGSRPANRCLAGAGLSARAPMAECRSWPGRGLPVPPSSPAGTIRPHPGQGIPS